MINNLIPCTECGAPVSKHATTCPRCKSTQRYCILCDQSVKKQDLYQYHEGTEIYHKGCLRANFGLPESLSCPDCNMRFKGSDLEKLILSLRHVPYPGYDCTNCGNPNPLQSRKQCEACGFPIFLKFQNETDIDKYLFKNNSVSTIQAKTLGDSFVFGWNSDESCGNYSFHDFCLKGTVNRVLHK